MARVRNIGLPVNDSERKAIATLAAALPDDTVLLNNLELPTQNGFPYEYDIIAIGASGVFVIEVKGYGGTIKGNASEWELHSGQVIKSPIPLLHTKTRIVGTWIKRWSPLLTRVMAQPLLVLSDDQVQVNIRDPFAPSIVKLDKAVRLISSAPAALTAEMIAKCEEAIARHFLPLKTDREIGDYRLLAQIIRNELYTAFIAEHKLLGGRKKYLLKIYTLKLYDDLEEQEKHRQRILREATTLCELPPHPNLVRANPPFPAEDDKIVLPLEWVEGHSLRGLLDDPAARGGIPVRRVLLDLCSVLAHVHRHGVVHRDLRPDNVIFCADGTLRLVNFDCAQLSGGDGGTIATRVGRHLDERYVAPEVWMEPGSASVRSDIYSLGILLHELLTGRTPYLRMKEIFATCRVEGAIRALRTDLDPEVEELFLSMCAFDRRERLDDLAVVTAALERLL